MKKEDASAAVEELHDLVSEATKEDGAKALHSVIDLLIVKAMEGFIDRAVIHARVMHELGRPRDEVLAFIQGGVAVHASILAYHRAMSERTEEGITTDDVDKWKALTSEYASGVCIMSPDSTDPKPTTH